MIPATINTWHLRDLIFRHVRQPHTSDTAEKTEYSPLNKYPTGGCNLHDWTMTYNVSTSSQSCKWVVVVLSSDNCKCNYSTTAHRARRMSDIHIRERRWNQMKNNSQRWTVRHWTATTNSATTSATTSWLLSCTRHSAQPKTPLQ
jgi:hypothetical protein